MTKIDSEKRFETLNAILQLTVVSVFGKFLGVLKNIAQGSSDLDDDV